MGSGKSKSSYLRSGPRSFENSNGTLGSGGTDGVYSSKDANTLVKEIERRYYDDGEEIDMSLVGELRKRGINVDIMGITTNNIEIPKVVKDLIKDSGISLDEFSQVFGGKSLREINRMVFNYSYSNVPNSVKKVLEARANLGLRSASVFDRFFATVGKDKQLKDLYGSKDRIEINQNINASLRIASRLIEVSGGDFPKLFYAGSTTGERIGIPLGMYDSVLKKISLSTQQFVRDGYVYRDRSWSVSSNLNLRAVSVIHEYGHYIDCTHGFMSDGVVTKSGSKSISKYGDTSQREAFAEAFTAYCLGTTPKQGSSYYKEFCNLMSSKGMTHFKGCIS